jgi:hypothetical protein
LLPSENYGHTRARSLGAESGERAPLSTSNLASN